MGRLTGRIAAGDTVFAKKRMFTLRRDFFRGDEFVVTGVSEVGLSLRHVASGEMVLEVGSGEVTRGYVDTGKGPRRRVRR